MVLQKELILELVYYPLDDLALARRPQPGSLVPRPFGVVLGSGRNYCPVILKPVALPCNRGEALVGEVGCMSVVVDEDLADGPLVGGGLGQAEGRYHSRWRDREAHLETVDPLGLGGTPSEGGLCGEQPLRHALTLTTALR